MTWRTVMRDDLQSVRRSRLAQGTAAAVFLVTLGVPVGMLLFNLDGGYVPEFSQVMLYLTAALAFVLPLFAFLASYGAIIGERTTGSIRFLLGLPNSRAEVYAGKYLSRAVLVVAPLTVGLLAGGAFSLFVFPEPAPLALVALLVVSVLYALVFVGFGLSLSGAFSTETRVTAGIVGVYVLFRGVWMLVQWAGVILSPDEELYGQPHSPWYYYFGRLNPMNAYAKASMAGMEESTPLVDHVYEPEQFHSFATTPEYALLALALWVVVAPLVGYVRFENRDVL